MTLHSVPPSPTPPPPDSPRAPLPSLLNGAARFPAGWSPGEDDISLQAIDWRASKGLQVARRVEKKHDELAPEVAKLSAVLSKLVRVVTWGGAFFGLALAGSLTKSAVEWILTLHH